MLSFEVDLQSCTRCGECIADCPARIIVMEEGVPTIAPDREATCYRCQHCLAICPTGAVSILGLKPSGSRPLAGSYPDPDKLEALIRGRRSVRRYKQENLEPGRGRKSGGAGLGGENRTRKFQEIGQKQENWANRNKPGPQKQPKNRKFQAG